MYFGLQVKPGVSFRSTLYQFLTFRISTKVPSNRKHHSIVSCRADVRFLGDLVEAMALSSGFIKSSTSGLSLRVLFGH